MVVFHIISDSFLAISDKLCIFAPMSDKDQNIIERLLNPDKTTGGEILELCSYAIDSFIAHYHENYKDKESLRVILANELYDYIIRKDLLRKFEGKNAEGKECSLKTYLDSIAKYRLPRVEIEDILITKTKEKKRREEEKQNKIIKEFDDEPLNFFVYKSTPIPTEFRDDDEAFDDEYLYVEVDEDEEKGEGYYEEDVVIEFNELDDYFIDTATNTTIELVRQALELLPKKESLLLKKQFYEGCDTKELAEELGHTCNVIYNLRSQAMRDFKDCYNKLKNGLL